MKPKKTSPGKRKAASPRVRRRTTDAAEPDLAASAQPEGAPTPRKRATRPRRAPEPAAAVPPILMEGDQSAATSVSGPGQRYALGPQAPAGAVRSEGELPESYGTKQLLLAARDPHWLYAHWDLTREQQRQFNALSTDRHLVLRIFLETASGQPAGEVSVHPESKHWFVHVDRAGARYVAELGYYGPDRRWVTVSTSGPTMAPPDTVSPETTAEFVTIPFELPMARLLSLVKEAVRQHVPLARALEELRAHGGHPDLPPTAKGLPAKWTPEQERGLAAVISMDEVRRVWMGSLEITELIRRQALRELASMAAAQAGVGAAVPTSPGIAFGITSPGRVPPAQKGFWFNVNAELIIYGATEADAQVTIGGRGIKLRPDGSFSYRFVLPDGRFELPVVAVSADGTDGRAAELKFRRQTTYRGDVGAHPQDPALARPEAASV